MHRWLSLFAAAAALAASGCADLSSVREFASLSSSITGSSELSARWADTQERLRKIPVAGDQPLSLQTDDRSKIHAETEKFLAAVTAYMDVMGQLASDEAPSVDSQVASLRGALSALPNSPITQERVDAVGTIVSLISKPLDAYRHTMVRQLIADADPPLQKILAGLQQLATLYREGAVNERKAVKDWMAAHLAASGKDTAGFLSRRHLADVDRKYDEVEAGIDAYIKALRVIAARHESLVNGLATDETIRRTIPQLKAARKDLIEARDKIRSALAQKI